MAGTRTGKSAAKRKTEKPHTNGQQEEGKKDFFTRFASQTSRIAGSSAAFAGAVAVIIIWAVTGPMFKFSDTWQLVINTGTTIVTFLMVFLIQNTQNRDSQAMHLKIDALIVANKHAKNILIEMEDLSQEELDALKRKFAELAKTSEGHLSAEGLDDCIEDPNRVAIETLDETARQKSKAKPNASGPSKSKGS